MLPRYAPPDRYCFLTVRTDTEDHLAAKNLMEEASRKAFPDELSTIWFMDEVKAGSTLVNTNIKILFVFLGTVLILLSVISLFSLVSLNLLKRMKEIGVCKVFGASASHIGLKVSRAFILILSIASIIGCVGAYYLSKMLMASIWTYYVPQ